MWNSKVALLVLLIVLGWPLYANTPEGYWLARSPMLGNKPVAKVKIYIINDTLQGELIEVLPTNNDIEYFCWQKARNLVGPVILCGYREEQGKWVDGIIYESTTGKAYKSEISVSPEGDRLFVKGMTGGFSNTAIWDRLKR